MNPEILIVGDPPRRESLAQRIAALGYDTAVSPPEEIDRRLEDGPAPAAIVVCTGGEEAPMLMARLRRSRQGAAVPVTLCGRLGSAFVDLADVLDLGADHFLEEPIGDDQLRTALEALAGPPEPTVLAVGSEAAAPARPTASDPMAHGIGQRYRSLELLEARPAEVANAEPLPALAADVELDALGPDAVPQVEVDRSALDPSDSSDSLAVPGLDMDDPEPDATVVLEAQGTRPEPALRRPEPRAPSRDGGPLDPMALEISLEEIQVSRALWQLHREQYDGVAVFRRNRVEKRLWLVAGTPVYGESNLGSDRFIESLLQAGRLTPEQYDAVRAQSPRADEDAARTAVAAGALKPSELVTTLRIHVLRVVHSCFAWNRGACVLVPGERAPASLELGITMPALLWEGLRDRVEAETLRAWLEASISSETYVRLASPRGPSAVAEAFGLGTAASSWLAELTGQHTVGAWIDAGAPDEAQHRAALGYLLELTGGWERASAPWPSLPVDRSPPAIDRERIESALARARASDYFEVLGLHRSATALDVRRAHTALRATFGEDAVSPEVQQSHAAELEELREVLDQAKAVLTDDTLRSVYAAHLEDA